MNGYEKPLGINKIVFVKSCKYPSSKLLKKVVLFVVVRFCLDAWYLAMAMYPFFGACKVCPKKYSLTEIIFLRRLHVDAQQFFGSCLIIQTNSVFVSCRRVLYRTVQNSICWKSGCVLL